MDDHDSAVDDHGEGAVGVVDDHDSAVDNFGEGVVDDPENSDEGARCSG